MEEDPSETGSVSEASADTWPLGPASCTGPPSAHSADPDQSFSARSWSEQEASESTALNSPSVADGVASCCGAEGRSTPGQMGDPVVRRKEDKSKSLLGQIDHLGPTRSEDGSKHIDAAEFDKAETAAALNDEVERSILELLDVVKACRRKSQAANTLQLESRDVPQAHTDIQRPPAGTVKVTRPSSAPSRKGQAVADTTRRSDAKRLRVPSPTTNEAEVTLKPTPAKAEDPAALARIDALQEEAKLLRTELREADLQIQTAASESAAANADLRETRLRHQRWLRSMQEESFRLRKENQRLEKSCQQANAEERRIADLAQSQPAICQKLAALKAACERLESENEKLEQELQAGQSDLNRVRDVPQAGPGSEQRSSPSVGGQNRALTPPGRGPAKRLEQNSSTPVLRRSLHG